MKIAAAEALWWSPVRPTAPSRSSRSAGANDETPTQILRSPTSCPSWPPTTSTGGPGPQQPPGAVLVRVRAGQLHPQRLHPVLVYAGHGLPREPRPLVRPLGGLAAPSKTLGRAKWFLWSPPGCDHGALPRQHRRVDADRERPPTVDRPGPLATKTACPPRSARRQVWISLILFWGVFLALGATDLFLMVRYARKVLTESGRRRRRRHRR